VGGKCHTPGWPIASHYTHYAVLAHKTSIKRYTEHTSYTRSNNTQVAYAVHTLNNCHEYYPVDEIMGLAKCLKKFSYAFTQIYC
jgi:hypothetical protein